MFLPALACGQLLDIGCGNGSFLAGMRERGWEVQGLEPDSEAADLARKRHGLKVITGTLEETSLSVSSVDAITLNHVIEHVPDPVGLLSECRRILKPGGKLVVATPNVESLAHRMSGVRWQHLDPPRHLCLFSSRALTACVEKAGLQPESLHTRVPFRSWASLFLENAASLVDRKAGEELVLVARGPGSLGAG
jgi:2-polyprenyl-3-methyl-5-hydroxy-6-metoxy-1,4-benzoquinol methylase